MEKLDKILAPSDFKKTRVASLRGFTPLMKATLTEDYFDDPNWIYERKLDGIRCEVVIKQGKVSLYSRNQNSLTDDYPQIAKSLKEKNYPDLVLDGELVAFEGNQTSFSQLQARKQLTPGKAAVDIYFYVFDIIYYDGFTLKELSLRSRKKILKKVLDWDDPIRFTPHRNKEGLTYFEEACEKGWEGIIAKNATSEYVASRSKNWLKFKCTHQQELVIGGFTEPQGERKGFGALLVGYFKKGKLYYAGKVGTGFDDAFLKKWRANFNKITQKESPFHDFNDTKMETNNWITPKYVGQFGFTEWTKTNKLRHPRFLGMRLDKEATEVVKETPKKITIK